MFLPWPEGSQENGKEETNDGILLRRLDRVSNMTSDKKITAQFQCKEQIFEGLSAFPHNLIKFL